jgi:multidrug efflux pump subunit AcrA (membrane-fusion protein)
MKKYTLYAFIMILIFAGCKNVDKKEIKSKVEVKTAEVTMQTLKDKVQAIGETKSKKEILLSSQFNGRVVLLNVLPGDKVKKGDLIARIRRKEAEAISSQIEGEFSDISIISPISGSVIEKYVSEGDVVTQGQPIVKIVARKPLYLLIDVPEEYFGKIKAGNKVKFVSGSKAYTGRVTAKSTAIDPLTGTFKVRANITGKGLLPGVFGKVLIMTEQKNCTAVPRKAVLTKDGEKVVFVVEENRARMKKVETGIETDKYIEIKKGLKVGDIVATIGNYELEDGMEVKVK